MTKSNRIFGLDVLRGTAMMLGVVLHAGIAYKEGYHYGEWVMDPSFTSYFFDWMFLFINSFRMQLFFLLAGFFARMVILRSGLVSFLKNRMKRVGLPLVISYFTILPLTLIPFLYSIFEKNGDPVVQLKSFFVDFFTFKTHYGLMHLWFLQHLILFYLIFVTVWNVSTQKIFTGISNWLGSIKVNALTFVVVICIFVWIVSMFYRTALPSIWTGFKIPVVQLLYYLLFFTMGWVLHTKKELINSFKKYYILFLTIGLILSLATVVLLNSESILEYGSATSIGILKLVFSIQTVSLMLGLIGLFTTVFVTPSKKWQYIADSAYWTYLIHMPFVLTFQLLLKYSSVPGLLRFPIVVILSLALSLISYQLLVRYTWIGKLLNGPRERQVATSNQ